MIQGSDAALWLHGCRCSLLWMEGMDEDLRRSAEERGKRGNRPRERKRVDHLGHVLNAHTLLISLSLYY